MTEARYYWGWHVGSVQRGKPHAFNRVRISQINSWRIRSIHSVVEVHSVSYIVTISACQIEHSFLINTFTREALLLAMSATAESLPAIGFHPGSPFRLCIAHGIL